MAVSVWTETLVDWRKSLEELKSFVAPAFRRIEQRRTAGVFMDGLLSGVERKTGWMLSEEAGFGKPYRIQSLLGRSSWSADALCDLVRRYALDALCDSTGVLVVDETGFLKKGAHSVGVARQYSGTAGRIENCQIGVFAAYASRWGHTLIDRQLYLPKTWAADPDRRAKAHVPQEVGFATKPQMAREMVSRLLDEGVPCAFVLADAVYGSDSGFRRMLEQRRQPYVLAVRSTHTLRLVENGCFIQADPATLVEELDTAVWKPLAAGEGAKGPRLYEWARLPIGKQTKYGL